MNKVGVYVEHASLQLNQVFTYHSHTPIQPGCRVRVPFGAQTCIGFVTDPIDMPEDKIKEILEIIDEKPVLNQELLALADWMSDYYVTSKIGCYKTMLPPALRPSSHHAKIIYEPWALLSTSDAPLTSRQKEVLESVSFPIKASVFRKQAKSVAAKLIEKGYVRIENRPKEPDVPIAVRPDTDYALTQEQTDALKTIEQSSQQVCLLHGVTGSGKTEVFLQLARRALDQGKQVLFLVPEIGLTPMMIERVKARFGQRIAIYHSRLSDQEKYNEYKKVKEGKADIVVGTRSAVFMPFEKIGLILMDEEHDGSYKQDSSPRYHTRDVAIQRAMHHRCKVILSSATPSLESYARAYKNQYQLVSLKKRIYQQMPEIQLIDMKQEQLQSGISTTLYHEIQDRLQRKEQVILLLNRRGYLPVVRCMDCNEVISCPDCGLALSYHKSENVLMCHCCGTVYSFHHQCPNCSGKRFYQGGQGTEKLEEQIREAFPSAHIVRMDADSTRKKNAHAKKLAEFEQSGDILLGTQMVAKGLDFPRVTLVGILNADASLARLDYRSSETAFDLLTQASGRSGREKKAGKVLIQTFDVDHYIMQCVQRHDYLSFFKKEMSFRHLGNYPPYVYLCTLIFSHKDAEKAYQAAREIKQAFPNIQSLGPLEISMRQRNQRVRLVLKHKSKQELKRIVWKIVQMHQQTYRNVKLDINMYPLSLEE